MIKTSFVMLSVVVLMITSAPVFVFSYLKYNGLEDVEGGSYVEEEEEVGGPTCKFSVKSGDFQYTFTPGGPNCGAVICRPDGCAIRTSTDVESEDTLVLGQSAELIRLVSEEFLRVNPPENSEVIENESDIISQNLYKYPLWQWLSIFSVAITFSIIGVSSSIILRKNLTMHQSISSNIYSVFGVLFLASISGVLIVSLFAGGFLQGNVFPNFTGDEANFGFNSWIALKFRGQDWFKLAVWAYIAGFYERFLPDSLERIIERSTEKAPQLPDDGNIDHPN